MISQQMPADGRGKPDNAVDGGNTGRYGLLLPPSG